MTTEVQQLRGRLAALSQIIKLGQGAFEAPTPAALASYIVNRSLGLIPADRSTLLEVRQRRVRVLAQAGQAKVVGDSAYNQALRTIAPAFPALEAVTLLAPDVENDVCPLRDRTAFSADRETLVIVPLRSGRRRPDDCARFWVLGFWQEASRPAADGSLPLLRVLYRFYADAFESLDGRGTGRFRLVPGRWGRSRWLWLAVIVAALLVFVRVRDTVSADFELRPLEENVVYAPFPGTLRECLVGDGAPVKAGQAILRYDSDEVNFKLVQAMRRCELARMRYEVAQKQSVKDPASLAAAKLLQLEMASEAADVDLCKWYVEHSTLYAGADGRVFFNDIAKLLNRSLTAGERLFEVIPEHGALIAEVYLNERDAAVLTDPEQLSLALYLHTRPEQSLRGELLSVSPQALPIGLNHYGYRIRVKLAPEENSPELLSGMRGIARVQGPRVSLGFYLFRNLLIWWHGV